jgi:hypothetical protein
LAADWNESIEKPIGPMLALGQTQEAIAEKR